MFFERFWCKLYLMFIIIYLGSKNFFGANSSVTVFIYQEKETENRSTDDALNVVSRKERKRRKADVSNIGI